MSAVISTRSLQTLSVTTLLSRLDTTTACTLSPQYAAGVAVVVDESDLELSRSDRKAGTARASFPSKQTVANG